MNRLAKLAVAALLGSTALSTAVRADVDDHAIKRVLLLSVDGMHEVDLQRYVAGHPASTFANLPVMNASRPGKESDGWDVCALV